MFGRRRQARQGNERQTFSQGETSSRYQMHAQLISIGDDYWIENQAGEKVYRVDGQALRLRRTLIFEDAHGNQLAKLQERMFHIRDTMQIEGPHGEPLAVVKKALLTPLRNRLTVCVNNGPDMDVQGNILDHEYTIGVGRDKVAEVSKKWFRVRNTYGVEIAAGQTDFIILAVTVVIDAMAH